MRGINKIVIHCSATPEGKDFDVNGIRKWHIERGFNDVGYHWVIKLDGTIQKGRVESRVGAHAKNHNHDSIGVCYIGGCDANMKAKDTRTVEQKEALKCLLIDIKQRYPKAVIIGHRDLPNVAKDCPSFDAKKEYSELK